MLYMAPDSPKLARLQGCFVADVEIRNLVNYWKAASSKTTPVVTSSRQPEASSTEPPWAELMAEADKDDLLEEAIKLVTDSGRASTSFLQRRLGVGYPRASRLMDLLESEGVIGPAEGSKPREVFWREDRDREEDEFNHDMTGSPPLPAKHKG
jgi:S-DNA-T family DNA segregation ATPase FtsK/SpoIIIE